MRVEDRDACVEAAQRIRADLGGIERNVRVALLAAHPVERDLDDRRDVRAHGSYLRTFAINFISSAGELATTKSFTLSFFLAPSWASAFDRPTMPAFAAL